VLRLRNSRKDSKNIEKKCVKIEQLCIFSLYNRQEFRNIYKILKPGGNFRLSIITSHDAFTLYGHMVNHPIFGSYFEV